MLKITRERSAHGSWPLTSRAPFYRLLLDEEYIARGFEAVWQAETREGVSLDCTRIDARYEPGARCVATYRLHGERAGAPHEETVGVVEMDATGKHFRLYQDDPALPTLSQATNPAEVKARVADSALFEGSELEGPKITPLHYKPGRSCVLRYDISGRPGGERSLIAKVAPQLGGQYGETMHALHEAALANPLMPRIPAPLAHWPELQLWIHPHVPRAVDMTPVAFGSPQNHVSLLRKAGIGIATFHHRVLVPGPRRRAEDDLRRLDHYLPLFRELAPDLTRRFFNLRSELARLASTREEPSPAAGHGTLRTGQFLVSGDQLTLVDLDEYCWANPARDAGNLLAYLDWRAIRSPAEADSVAEAEAAFLDGYSDAGRRLDESWLALYRAMSLLKIAGRRLRRLEFQDWPFLSDLLAAAEATAQAD